MFSIWPHRGRRWWQWRKKKKMYSLEKIRTTVLLFLLLCSVIIFGGGSAGGREGCLLIQERNGLHGICEAQFSYKRSNKRNARRRNQDLKTLLRRLKGGRGGVNVPLFSSDPSQCDAHGVFYLPEEKPNPKPGTDLEVALGLADETYEWAERKPKIPLEGDPREIMLEGLPIDMKEQGCAEYFSQYGAIVDVKMPVNQRTGKSRGIAFITYEDPEDAKLMVWDINGATPFGNEIRGQFAKKGQYQALISEDEAPDEDEQAYFERLNDQALGDLGHKNYEDFMLESRSASPGDDPRELHWRQPPNILAEEDPNAQPSLTKPGQPRILAEEGQEPVGDQELVEGLLGAPRGTLNRMFENEEEEKEAIQDEIEGFGSGFDRKQGFGDLDYGDKDYNYGNRMDDARDVPGMAEGFGPVLDENARKDVMEGNVKGTPLDFVPNPNPQFPGHG